MFRAPLVARVKLFASTDEIRLQHPWQPSQHTTRRMFDETGGHRQIHGASRPEWNRPTDTVEREKQFRGRQHYEFVPRGWVGLNSHDGD